MGKNGVHPLHMPLFHGDAHAKPPTKEKWLCAIQPPKQLHTILYPCFHHAYQNMRSTIPSLHTEGGQYLTGVSDLFAILQRCDAITG